MAAQYNIEKHAIDFKACHAEIFETDDLVLFMMNHLLNRCKYKN